MFEGEECWFDEDGEEYPGEGHYECRGCAAEVPEPGTKVAAPAGMKQYMHGMTRYYIQREDDIRDEITEAEYKAIVHDLRAKHAERSEKLAA